MSPRYRTRAFRFFPPIVRGTRRDSDLDSKSRNYKYYLIIIKASKKLIFIPLISKINIFYITILYINYFLCLINLYKYDQDN